MAKTELKAVLDRALNWPEEKQQQLAELALEIEAEIANSGYTASADELQGIDEGRAGDPASDEEVAAAFAEFRPE